MGNKQIQITYSNGEEDNFSINENLDEKLLMEALAKLDMQALDDIYGDIDTTNKRTDNNQTE